MGKKRPRQDQKQPASGKGKASITKPTSKPTKEVSKGKPNKGKPHHHKEESLGDWISNLAKQETANSSSTNSKADRIQKRKAKHQRREDRKEAAGIVPRVKEDNVRESTVKQVAKRNESEILQELAAQVKDTVEASMEQDERPRPYTNTIVKIKGQAKNKQWEEESIQPRNRDYGGIGLARPSLFLPLSDPSFIPKLQTEFEEHVPGFFGKTRTKAMKKQLNSQMLWRKLSDKKTQDTLVNGKKLSDMSPDDRVEAMIQAGMM